MESPRRMDPLEALEILVSKRNRRKAQAFAVEDAPCAYLAEPLESIPRGAVEPAAAADEEGVRRAAWNGYALPPGVEAGDECRILGTLTPGAPLDAEGFPLRAGGGEEEAPGNPPGREAGAAGGARSEAPGIWRVETGAILPRTADRVLPVSHALLVGRRRVRVLEPALPGDGVGGLRREGKGRKARAPSPVPRFPEGTRLDARLRSILLARESGDLLLQPPFAVGFAALGDELVDLGASAAGGTRHELTAFWLADAISALGLTAVPLGILPDSPGRIRDAILRALGKKVDVLITAGGLGDGVTDRTAEALERFGARILLHGLDLDGCRQLLFAKTQGIDIIGLSGRPLAAACAFDLFARPALLARQGAARALWDWSRCVWPVEAGCWPEGAADERSAWRVLPAAMVPGGAAEAGASLRVWEPESDYAPLAAGQEGWALRRKPAPGWEAPEERGKLGACAYFQKSS